MQLTALDTSGRRTNSNRPPTSDKDDATDDTGPLAGLVDRLSGLAPGADTTDDRPNPTAGVDIDTLLDQLASERRRLVIRALAERTAPMRIGDLSRHIAAYEAGCTPEEVTSTQRKRVYVALYQTHLDTLDEADFIDYEKNCGEIHGTPETEVAAAVLADLDARLGGGPDDI
ncbi:DUF7344 domain-containing protein [Halovenus marina]|uniref:DUF7344 domain-containing protein n=1 Tax=Halovenus marina TaxID=3396621 RepID=UPI003F54B01C